MIKHWINGKPWDSAPERAGDVYDPATGKVASQVAFASVSEVDAAVSSAAEAFVSWRNASLAQRSTVMFKFRELLNDRKGELPQILRS